MSLDRSPTIKDIKPGKVMDLSFDDCQSKMINQGLQIKGELYADVEEPYLIKDLQTKAYNALNATKMSQEL